MALSVYTRRKLAFGLCSVAAGLDVLTVVNAGSGTLAVNTGRRLRFGAANSGVGNAIVTAVNAGSSLADRNLNGLAVCLADRTAANEIDAALDA
jgi:hypothetical protein